MRTLIATLVIFIGSGMSPTDAGGQVDARSDDDRGSAGDAGASASFDVREATIAQVHAAMVDGRLTAEALIDAHLQRIEDLDDSTGLNAMICINPDAAAQVRDLDEEFARTGELRPLHGIPVIVKDNYDIRGFPTTAGSLVLSESMPPDDAFQVKRLREAGAIIVGKSNMAEFAFSPFVTVSSLGGITLNPYDLERVPAGSSGGTAAAVAANLGMIGLGTDTGNSIRGPSSHTSLVGIRPTLGLTSRDGIVPLYLRNDVGGPMCRTVEDAARLLEVIAGSDEADPITMKSQGKIPASYLDSLDEEGLQGARIGVFRTLTGQADTDDEYIQLFEQALVDMQDAGAILVDPIELPDLFRRQRHLWKNTFRLDIANYLASVGGNAPVHTLQQIMDSGQFHPSIANRLAASRQSTDAANLSKPSSADPADAPARQALLEDIVALMDEHDLDAIVYPSWNNPPRKVNDLRSPSGNNSPYISPHTGQPAITVPMGFSAEGLPAGLQILGRRFDEPTILRIAYAYEQTTRHRRPAALFNK